MPKKWQKTTKIPDPKIPPFSLCPQAWKLLCISHSGKCRKIEENSGILGFAKNVKKSKNSRKIVKKIEKNAKNSEKTEKILKNSRKMQKIPKNSAENQVPAIWPHPRRKSQKSEKNVKKCKKFKKIRKIPKNSEKAWS